MVINHEGNQKTAAFAMNKTLEYREHITRAMLQAQPNVLFVFGDNMVRRGFGGQAKEMRGEPNAVGIPTKWRPGIYDMDYLHNGDLSSVTSSINRAFKLLQKHPHIIWPARGIGTGYAKLKFTAPAIWEFIENKRKELEKGRLVKGEYHE